MGGGALVVAVDLGGTRCKAALVQLGDEVPRVLRRTAPIDVVGADGDRALATITSCVLALAAEGADAVGLALPGLHDGGVLTSLPGKFPGLEGRDVAAAVTDATGLPCTVANDAVAHGVGEAVAGAGRERRVVVVVTIGTGVGTSVLVDGRPVGAGPLAGGLLGGQVPISFPGGPTDTAGRRGTIEARCRAQQLLAEAVEAGSTAVDVPAVLALASQGDAPTLEGVARWREWLVRALVALGHAHAADLLVVGGGPLAAAPGILLDGVQDAVRAATWPGYDPEVAPSALGDDAALVGVAALTATAPVGSP